MLDERLALAGYLEVLSRSEGEGGQGFLLGAPALGQEGVSDEDLFLQTRVQMKSDVSAAGHSQVYTKTEPEPENDVNRSGLPPSG